MRCLFPLRTSVEWFENPASPSIEERVKQAVALYDEVLFEDGFIEIDITSGGSLETWHPPEAATEERLAEANRPIEVGAPVVFSLGKQPAKGVPAPPEAMHVMMSGALQQRYVAELMFTVMDRIAEFNDGWAIVSFTGNATASTLDRWLPHRSTRACWDKTLMPDLQKQNPSLREFIIKSFDRDAALATMHDADFQVSPLFRPVASYRAPEGAGDEDGRDVLRYIFPDITDLPWEVVMEFREHDASREARAKLQEAVDVARREGIVAADTRLTRDMVFAEKELRKRHSLKERAGKVVASVVPLAGGALAEGAGALAEAARDRRDWVAALTLLRR